MGTVSKLLVAIPAYNEQSTVTEVVAAVRQVCPTAHVVVVDDGSSDKTGTCARAAGATVLTLPFNVGVGGAMRTAFLYAHKNNYPIVVQVDADGQHNPESIPQLVTAVSEGADVVLGSRFGPNGGYTVAGPRKWAMIMLSTVLSKITRTSITDTTSGFRASGPDAIHLFSIHYPSEYLGDTVESLLLAHRAGLTIEEVYTPMGPRLGGEPSQNPLKASLYLGRALLALFSAKFGSGTFRDLS